MKDISISKNRAVRYGTPECEAVSTAGYLDTRREPVRLTDRQSAEIREFADQHVPPNTRDQFFALVTGRLSGAPGGAAVHGAIIAAAIEIGFTAEKIQKLGLRKRIVVSTKRLGSSRESQLGWDGY